MSKLHELLAVEKDKKSTVAKILAETAETFTKKQQHFDGFSRIYESKTSDAESFDSEMSHVVTTVPDKLGYFEKYMVNLFDVLFQKESTNITAKADIIAEDGDKTVELAKDVPVQALVQIENILESIRNEVYNVIPTLDPKHEWLPDAQKGKGYWKTDESRKRKTKKVTDFVVPVQATKEHPAQVKEVSKDIYTGDWVETHYSGRFTPAQKSELMRRLSLLIEAVKKARARANNVEVVKGNIGNKIFQFLKNAE